MKDLLNQICLAGLKPPKRVTLMMTNGCNLFCSHCWPQSTSFKNILPVPAAKLLKTIDELLALNVESICLTGGEPLTHPDWFKVLDYACGKEFGQVTFQTNGTLLDDFTANQLKGLLKELGSQKLQVQISLDGGTQASHDKIRGKGSFKKTVNALKLLSEKGMGKQTIVAFTEMQHNFSDLPLLLKRVDKLGLSGIVSGTMMAQGRAKKSKHISPPEPEQYEKLLLLYATDSTFRSRYDRLGNISAIEWYKGLEWHKGKDTSPGQSCGCIETPLINFKGEIYPCLYLQVPQFAATGIFDTSLESVLRDALPLWSTLPELDQKRRRELEPCKVCKGRYHCQGGCTGRSYAVASNFSSLEDRCELRKKVYSWCKPESYKKPK